MAHHLIDIEINNSFRAIKKAHIHIDGISVISGINGCGKSTISKLLYSTIKNTLQYDQLVFSLANDKLAPYRDVFAQMQMQLMPGEKSYRHVSRWFLSSNEKKESYLDKVHDLCDKFLREEEGRDDTDSLMSERLWRIIRGAVNDEHAMDISILFGKLQSRVSDILDECYQLLGSRPRDILMKRLSFQFGQSIDDSIKISEYGDAFIGSNEGMVPLPHYIQQVAYIDTPMIIGLDLFDGPDYWDHLRELLQRPVSGEYDQKIYTTLQSEILHGEAQYDDDSVDDFLFRREDGQTFDLFKCATGVKSFSILQLLLKNGTLRKNTLLIIDEPEAHLHPQWVVEYARMVLLLHQNIGVKFLIASHSTDFVGAMKEIAAVMGVEDLNFYLAEEVENMQYNYLDLGNDVEPIFASFNKSYEKLDYYAKPE